MERTDDRALLLRPAVIDLTDAPVNAEATEADISAPEETGDPSETAAAPPSGDDEATTAPVEPGEPTEPVEPEPVDPVEQPGAEADLDMAETAGPPDGANAIYRMFGYRPPGDGAA